MGTVYLDNAATTKSKQEVINVMMPYLNGDKWHNPSSLYSAGVKVKSDIESARKTVANFIGADSNEVYFTSSGSESNCWALRGFVDNVIDNDYHPVIITSQIEHKSILSCVHALAKRNVDVVELGVDRDGFIDVDELESFLNAYYDREHYKVLVSIQFANNEIGTIQPIKEVSEVAHHYNAVLHVDAVQAAGQIPINVNVLGIDMMTVSGHKIGCPRGSAFLYKKNGIEIEPLIFGSQEMGLRGGTESVHQIIGMAKAVELARDNVKLQTRIELTRDFFVDKLKGAGCKLIGDDEYRLPNNISVMMPEGVGGEETLYLLDMGNFQISTGSACNSREVAPSHVLKAIGLTDEEAARVIRITFSSDITFEQIEDVVNEIDKTIKLLSMQ